jgi:tRNA (guanine37-N1)-methyltransferase
MKKLTFHIITLFPEMCASYFSASIIERALRDGVIAVQYYNPRDYTKDKHRRVDRKPYGGGPGMVLEAPSILAAAKAAIGKKKDVRVLFFEPRGSEYNTAYAEELTEARHIVMICGRYEGVDARVKQALNAEGVSIGNYVLTGGELPAMVVVDSVTRRLPGVLGDDTSVEERRIAGGEVYTRPERIRFGGKEYVVPEVLRSGHHREIDTYRRLTKKQNSV